MPDDDPTPDDPTDPKPEPKPDDTPDPQAEIDKWKAMARKHEQQAKANADAAKKLQELEDAGKSEVEKATAAAAEATKRAEEAELRALRLEVAGEKKLTPSQAKRLVGNTREELGADADQLLEDFPAPEPPPGSKLPTRPKAPGSTGKPEELKGKERAAAALRGMRDTR